MKPKLSFLFILKMTKYDKTQFLNFNFLPSFIYFEITLFARMKLGVDNN